MKPAEKDAPQPAKSEARAVHTPMSPSEPFRDPSDSTSVKQPVFKVHFDFGGFAFCGTPNHYRLTNDEAKVTCERCKHKIGLQEAV